MNSRMDVFRSLHILGGYRHRVLEGVAHDIRQRYMGSVMGSLWAILFPLLQLGIYTALYTVIFRVRPAGLTEYGYVVLVFSGLVPIMAFNEALTAATSSLSSNKNLLLNTVFPAELIPLRAAIAGQVTGVVGLIATLVVGFSLGRTSWHAILLVPVFWVLLLMFAMGIGWVFSLFSLVARDIQHGLGLLLMLMLVLSPFAYTPDMVPSTLKLIIWVNPLSYFVLTFQNLICYGTWPDPVPAAGSVVLAFGSFFTGYILFRRAKHVFFDYA